VSRRARLFRESNPGPTITRPKDFFWCPKILLADLSDNFYAFSTLENPMKNKFCFANLRVSRRLTVPILISAIFACALMQSRVQAASGTWNVNNAGNWSAGANWLGGTIANDANSTANFVFNITANRTVTLDSSRTINKVVFTDATTASHDWTLAASGGSVLTLAGTAPSISSTNRTATVSAPLAGTIPWAKVGGNVLVLTGANTFSGVLTVSDGTLRAASAGALGNATSIVVQNDESPGAANTNALDLAGGFTFGAGKTLTLRNNSASNIPNARAQLSNQAGNNTWAGDIILDGGTNQTLSSLAGVLTITSDVGVSASPPTNLFIRGAASGVMDGKFNLGATNLLKTESGNWTINSTGSTHGLTTIANGSITLNNNEALAPATSLVFGEGNANTGTLTVNGGFTQSIGDVTVFAGSTTTTGHRINGPGSLDLGATPRAFSVVDAAAADDLTISAPLLGSGGFTKSGAGVLMMDSAVSGPVTVNAGTLGGTPVFNGGLTVNDGTGLIVGSRVAGGTLAASTLTFGTGNTSVAMNVGPGGDLVTVSANNGLTFDGVTTINISRFDGNLPVGVYPLINFTGIPQGSGGFVLGPLPPYLSASIIPTASGGALDVTASDYLLWTGNTDANWDLTTADNWKLASDNSPVLYQENAAITFGDSGLNPTVNVVAPVNPGWITFDNSNSGPAWRMNGLAINGSGGITKLNTGIATLANPVGLSGPVLVKNGTLEVDHDGGSLTATPQVDVAAGAALLLSADNGNFTFNRAITGSGTVVVDPVSDSATPASRDVTLSGNNSGFTGTLRLLPSGTVATNGSFRTVSGTSQANLGAATVDVDPGGQLWFSNPISNNLVLSGAGYSEVAGGTPATAATDAAGNPLTVPTFTYGGIGAVRMNGNSVIDGTVTLDGDAKIMPYNTTASITGAITNTASTDTLVLGGGNNGSTLIASGDLTGLERIWINGGGSAGVNVLQLGANGTTGELAPNAEVILYNDAAGASFRVNRSDGFTLGAGQKIIAAHDGNPANLSRSSFTINTPTPGTGFTIGANTIDLSDGTSGGTVYVAGQGGGGNGVANSLLNIGAGSVLDAGSLFLGEGTNLTATVEQSGGVVTLINQLRVGHYNNSSTYNLSGGSVTITGESPAANPSTAGATEQNGGIYLGIDGTGVLNQSAGSVTTNFVVLDNRGNTAAIDQYNLSGGSLNLTGTWGMIRRNVSAEFNFSGGTIRNAGSGLLAAIDCPLVVSNSPVLDTNGATNGLSLAQGLAGTAGTLSAQGGGTVFLNGTSTFPGTLSISDTTTLGGTGTFPGTASVTNVSPGASTAVGDAGTLTLGDPGAGTTTTTVAGTVTFDLNAASTVAGNDRVVVNDDLNLAAGKILPRFYGGVPVAGTYRLFDYTGTLTGAPAFDPAFVPSEQRMSFTLDTSVAQQVNLTLAGATGDIVWTGDGVNNLWDLNTTANWAGPTTFFQLDEVTFDESGNAAADIALTGTLLPSTVTVDSTSKNYTFAGTGQIGGGATLTKLGSSQLTVLANNTTTGATDIQGGIVQVGNGGTNGWLGSGGITSAGEIQFNRSDDVTLAAVLAGSGTVVQEGTGTLTLSGTNTLSGPIQVTAGILKPANVAAFGTSSGISVASGAQVNLNGTAFGNTRSYSYSIAGAGPDGRGAIINDLGSIAANAAVTNLTLTGNASIGAYGGTGDGNRFDIGFNGTLNGTITGNGFTLTKLGEAMVNTRGAATDISYVVAAGTLRAETSAASLGNTLVTVNTGARLDSWGALTWPVPLVFDADSRLTSSNGVGTWSGPVTLNGATTIGGGGAGITLTGVVSGASGSIIKADNATTLVLSNGANTYGGGTELVGGTIQAAATGALGSGPVVLSNTAIVGRLVVDGGVTVANDITIGAGTALAGVAGRGLLERAGTGQATFAGTITVNSGAAAGGTLLGGTAAGSELVFTGPLNLNVGASLRDGRAIFSGGGAGNGNTFNGTGTISLGANNGLPANLKLLLGGSAACTFDLAGFNQTLVGLTKGGQAGTVTNTGGAPSVLTLDLATDPNTYAGLITGDVALVKDGAAELLLTAAGSTFTGNVDINAGTVTVSAGHNDTNPNSALGNPVLGSRSVNVKNGSTLAFVGNDNLGNATSVPAMPIIVEAGGLLTNSGFNTLGPVTLNGATMSSTGGANATFQSYRLFGTISAGGTAPSVMNSTGANSGYHLHSSTTFNVADATADAAADLTVSAPLINQSGSQGSAAGNLVKDGAGTLVLAAVNAYTGNTTVNAGTLQLADDARLRFNLGAASGTNNALSGAGTVVLDGDFAIDTTAADALTAGVWLLEDVTSLTGPYGDSFQVVNPDGSPWANTGEIWTKTGAGGRTWTFEEGTGTLTLTVSGFDAWAQQIPNPDDRDRGDDPDGDGFDNGLEFLFGTSPIVNDGTLLSSERSGDNLVLRWLQRESGATYLLKESGSLAAGSWGDSAIVPVPGDQTGVPADYDRFTATIPIVPDRKFFRIEGTEN
jgi:autotransporter-associated beta strand protein